MTEKERERKSEVDGGRGSLDNREKKHLPQAHTLLSCTRLLLLIFSLSLYANTVHPDVLLDIVLNPSELLDLESIAYNVTSVSQHPQNDPQTRHYIKSTASKSHMQGASTCDVYCGAA